MNNIRNWLMSLTPEQRRAHCSKAGRKAKRCPRFKPGDARAVEAGRRGGLARAKKQRESAT